MPRQAMTETELDDFRARIRREAITIVAEVGLGALSMRKLAERLGVTAGALYRYYPSKIELIFDCSAVSLAELKTRFGAIEAGAENPLGAISEMMAAYAAFALEDKDRFRLLFLENDQGALASLESDAEAIAPYTILQRQVARAMEAGLIASADPAHVTHMLWAGVHGAVTLACTLTRFDLGDAGKLVEDITSALMKGLSTTGVRT
ncbi:TetR/AcrR family transcriptional regulator [Rhizobium paknamense]|uniref:AcrR family transcriptional regulator n=1 Tax=Rhizobium paknamense TaxID=1206817 RepID=A0ABU0II92_9HYPH|nr:TetR/AcrR family transcriptional regulator [Rhizobium paknamense]MDQ0457901.1 AcrR family transcriptional regulator [Rhizobium paknamense]